LSFFRPLENCEGEVFGGGFIEEFSAMARTKLDGRGRGTGRGARQDYEEEYERQADGAGGDQVEGAGG
jgi:hypothetical protein